MQEIKTWSHWQVVSAQTKMRLIKDSRTTNGSPNPNQKTKPIVNYKWITQPQPEDQT